MKNFIHLLFTVCMCGTFLISNAQSNSNTPARADSINNNRNTNQAVPASRGTEPNNRTILRSQTDSMDSRIKSPAPVRTLPDSTRRRNGMPDSNAPVYPANRRDSLK